MQIVYDHKTPIAGIGMVLWTRLGPERWFENYQIFSLEGWTITAEGAPHVIALSDVDPTIRLARKNSQNLIDNPVFQNVLLDTMPANGHVMTYKPVVVPHALRSVNFLSPGTELSARLENKRLFRELMHGAVPFPRYNVYKRSTLQDMRVSELLSGHDEVVVQDEVLSGGKGTFMVHDETTFSEALDALRHMSTHSHVVVSERIRNAHERSVQAVVTRHGIFVGPLQKQIIAHPLLANLDVPDGDKFCGAEITSNDAFSGAYDEIRSYALSIGQKIQGMGYKGIFSVDCLVTDEGQVFVLEVNPRITGITPLLTMMYREGEDIPFYLLHILELLGDPYEITDMAINPRYPDCSMLMLHSLESQPSRLEYAPMPGLYGDDGVYKGEAYRLDVRSDKRQVILQPYISRDLKPGGRIAALFANFGVLDPADNLTEQAISLVGSIHDQVVTTPLERS